MASQCKYNSNNIEISEYIELDSHADTSVIGSNCQVLELKMYIQVSAKVVLLTKI
jgi:hypothetical protein